MGDIDNGAAAMCGGEYIENFCMNLSLNFSMNLKLLYKVLDLKSGFVTHTSCTNPLCKKKINSRVLFVFSPEDFLKFLKSQSLF